MRTGFLTRLPAGGVALLVLVLAVLMAPHLKADTSVTYPVGSVPYGVAFDGVNIWVTNAGSNSVTKLLASTGATVGTYAAGPFPYGVAFDGANIWVSNSGSNSVTKLLASTGATVGTFTVGSGPQGIAFDGANIWVTNASSNSVSKLLASTGATVGTYPVGRSPDGVTFDGTNIWVANYNGDTVTKLLASTGATVGTYAVGSGPEGVAFDGANIWVTNAIGSVTKLLASSGATVGTYPVGNPHGVAFDGANIWVADYASNSVTELLASTGAIVGTYSVGSGPYGVAFDGANIWVTNSTGSSVTKISPASQQAPSISPGGIVPLYSTASTIQPGEWVSIYGNKLASGTAVWNSNFPTSLGGTSATINGKAAYLWYVSPGQINLQAPDDTAAGVVPVVVTTAGGSATSTVTLGQFGPSFSLLDAKHVAGIILRSNGSGAYGGGTYDILGPSGSSLGYPTVAARAGDGVALFGVGFGSTTPAVPAGQAFSGAAPTNNAVNLLLNNIGLTPLFVGLSSAGLYQINFTVPSGLGTGDISLQASVGGVQTPLGVVISSQNASTVNPTLTITTSGTGSGTVGSSPAGTSCGSGCLSFAAGTVVTLTASPNSGATFGGWSGACSGTAGCTVTMNSSQAVSATFNSVNGTPVSITSLSTLQANPLDPLTINGAGFDPANAAISVLLIPTSGGPAISVPAVAATPTTVQIAVPPIFDGARNAFAGGAVNVQVVQLEGTALFTSNIIAGLRINTLPPIPAGAVRGAVTAAFLASGLNVSSSVRGVAATNSKLHNLAAALSAYSNDLNTLLPAINAVMTNPGQSVPLTTSNGVKFILDSNTLTLSDQLIDAYVSQFVNQVVNNAGQQSVSNLRTQSESLNSRPADSTACPANYGIDDPIIEIGVCQTQQYAQTQAVDGGKAVQLGAKIETGFYLSFLGGWAAAGFAEAGAITEGAAKAYQLGWNLAVPYIAAFAASASPPSLYDSLKGSFAEIIDDAGLGGIGILPAALDASQTFQDASEIVASSAGTAPTGGLILTGPQANAPSGSNVVIGFQNSNGIASATTLAAPGNQQVTSIGKIIVPPPRTFVLTAVASTGAGAGGAMASFPAGISCATTCSAPFPTGTSVTLTAVANTGSTFAGWSGACSGTGSCTVTMNANQAVTATFNLATSVSVTPASANLGNLNGCSTSTQQLSQTFQVTAPAGVAWTAAIYGSSSTYGYGITTVSPSTGSGLGAFTVTVVALPLGATKCSPSSTPMSGSVVIYFDLPTNAAVTDTTVFVTVNWNLVT